MYLEGIRTVTSPAAFLGKAVHLGLESYYRHRQLGILLRPDQVIGRLDEIWNPAVAQNAVAFTSTADELACQKQAIALLKAYLRRLSQDEPRPLAVEAFVEAPLVDPLTGQDLGMPLVGIIDLVLPDASGAVIVDFKTTSRSAEPLETAHEVQLGCYAYLFRHAAGSQESCLEIRNIVKTKLPQIHFHRYARRDERHFARLFAIIRAYLDDLHSGSFLHRPGFGCAMCDFRAPCAISPQIMADGEIAGGS
jgi:hypothetical protein